MKDLPIKQYLKKCILNYPLPRSTQTSMLCCSLTLFLSYPECIDVKISSHDSLLYLVCNLTMHITVIYIYIYIYIYFPPEPSLFLKPGSHTVAGRRFTPRKMDGSLVTDGKSSWFGGKSSWFGGKS